jgi:hypothetical protein
MSSLLRLWEQTKDGRDFWDDKEKSVELNKEAMQVLQRGLEIRPDRLEGNTFWDDFISVLGNNSDGAANLLGVGRDVISKWSSLIRTGLKKIREDNASEKKKNDMIQTGSDHESE